MKDLRNNHCKVTLSELVNEALEIFFSKQYGQHRKRFEKRFFDRKKYLKKILSDESGENLDESLKSLVKKISSTSRKKKTDEA
ncbi:MAG: hypothetical protein HRT44_07845 [Bdellovibrionales bacterium]|nr:hypothetical protein [Bdellovibrionales bacterium]NQZ19151.1 hypothetical protein [Bdellovibrionales bacterium]